MAIKPKRRCAILAAHGGVCHYCGDLATHIDHIVPRIDGGSDDLGNLIAACLPCNLRKFRHRLPPDAERLALAAAEAVRTKVLFLDPPRRERTDKSVRLDIPIPSGWLDKVDCLRRRMAGTPTRTEAVRRLVEEMYDQRVSDAA
jgi:hypothetical protein